VDEYYNYFPISEDVPDYGGIVALDPFVVSESKGEGDGSIDDGATFPNDFTFDDSGAFPISEGDETLGGWWDSFVNGVSSAISRGRTGPSSGSSSSGGSSSGGKSSTTSTNRTATSVISDTGISPLVLFGMGALLLAAVYIGRNTK
jgi:hypothetical protein